MSDDSSGEILGIEKRKALIGAGVALALTLAAVAVLGQITSYGSLLTAVRKAHKYWLPLCLVGELVAYLGYLVAYRTVAAADGGPRLRLRDTAQVIALGLGAYVIGSGAGGLSVDYWAMHRAGAPRHEALRRTLALNTLQAAGLMTLAAAAAYYVLAHGPHSALFVMALVWACLTPACVVGATVVSDRRLAPRLLDVPESGRRPTRLDVGAWAHWVRRASRKVFGDTIGGVVFVRHVVAHPRRYLGGIVGYPLFWLGDFFTLWSALLAFGIHLSPPRLVIAEATAWALSFVPLPGGGSGAAEATMAYTLHAVGVPLAPAIFASITYRAVNFWLPILPALAVAPHLRGLSESLSGSERAGRDADAAVHGTRGLD